MENLIYTVDLRSRTNVTPKWSKIARSQYIGEKALPFDKFYLVPIEALPLVKKFCPYSFTLPLVKAYELPLKKIKLDFEELHKAGYKVVVPIHMTKSKNHADQLSPSYIVKRTWMAKKTITNFIPENAALTTPEGTLDPVCAYCTQSLNHIAGECYLGSWTCSQKLDVSFKPVDIEKYKAMEAAMDAQAKRSM